MQHEVSIAVAAVVLLATGRAEAGPITPRSVKADTLPKGVTFRGESVLAAHAFDDRNGTNYIVFSAKFSQRPGGESGMTRSAMLFVEDWVVPTKGTPRNLLPVRDLETDCEMGDLTAKFHDAAFSVTDLDRDGVAEVTFGYELACRSDVSPATYKLVLLENGKKFILRGETKIRAYGDEPAGGTFTADPDETRWPVMFLAHAKLLWAQTAGDLEIPPKP